MRGGEFAFAYWHPAWVCEVHEEVGAPMAKNIETNRDRGQWNVKVRNCGKDPRKEMEGVAVEMDIVFMTGLLHEPNR